MGSADGPVTVIVGTAGHIDHGKTSLVRALTGVELDTLPEERERGITIALGFTALEGDGRRVAFVDVPGHERLVRTMVAGAHGIDAVLLVVSAVEGVMPQTREHLAILDLLGVTQGAVVLSKVDLVDADLLELAEADVADLVDGTFLADAPVVPFSAVTGQGRDALVEVLSRFAPAPGGLDGPFRLSVDRAFVRPGFGTVVTGTSRGGTLPDGARVSLLPGGTVARVRGVQLHGAPATAVHGGQRVALNLAGVDRDAVPRGTVVTAGQLAVSSMIDMAYRHVGATALEDDMSVRVLVGTAERIGRVHLAGADDVLGPGDRGHLQLRLDEPVACLPGDRVVLRRTSPVETLGGGVVLDPWAPRMRRRDRAAAAVELARLAAGDVGVRLERAGEEGLPLAEVGVRAPGAPHVALGDRAFAPTIVARLEGLLLEAVVAYHQEAPLSLGAGRRELRRGRLGHLPDRVFDAVLERLAAHGALVVQGALVRAPTFAVALTPAQEALERAVEAALLEAGLTATDAAALRERHDDPALEALLHLLVSKGRAVQVPKLGFVGLEPLTELRRVLAAWFDAHEVMLPTDFKDLTGLTRRHAIPLLEALDRWGWTRRLAEGRAEGGALRTGPAIPSI